MAAKNHNDDVKVVQSGDRTVLSVQDRMALVSPLDEKEKSGEGVDAEDHGSDFTVLSIQRRTSRDAKELLRLLAETKEYGPLIGERMFDDVTRNGSKRLKAAWKESTERFVEFDSNDRSHIPPEVLFKESVPAYLACKHFQTLASAEKHVQRYYGEGEKLIKELYPELAGKPGERWDQDCLMSSGIRLGIYAYGANIPLLIMKDSGLQEGQAIELLDELRKKLHDLAGKLVIAIYADEVLQLQIDINASQERSARRQTEILEEFKAQNDRMKKMTSVISWCTITSAVVTILNFILTRFFGI